MNRFRPGVELCESRECPAVVIYGANGWGEASPGNGDVVLVGSGAPDLDFRQLAVDDLSGLEVPLDYQGTVSMGDLVVRNVSLYGGDYLIDGSAAWLGGVVSVPAGGMGVTTTLHSTLTLSGTPESALTVTCLESPTLGSISLSGHVLLGGRGGTTNVSGVSVQGTSGDDVVHVTNNVDAWAPVYFHSNNKLSGVEELKVYGGAAAGVKEGGYLYLDSGFVRVFGSADFYVEAGAELRADGSFSKVVNEGNALRPVDVGVEVSGAGSVLMLRGGKVTTGGHYVMARDYGGVYVGDAGAGAGSDYRYTGRIDGGLYAFRDGQVDFHCGGRGRLVVSGDAVFSGGVLMIDVNYAGNESPGWNLPSCDGLEVGGDCRLLNDWDNYLWSVIRMEEIGTRPIGETTLIFISKPTGDFTGDLRGEFSHATLPADSWLEYLYDAEQVRITLSRPVGGGLPAEE